MVKRHHLALPKEEPKQKEAQHEPVPKENASKPEPLPKSAPVQHQPQPEEKSPPPSEKKPASSPPQQPPKNTPPEAEEKPVPTTAPSKNTPTTAEKPAPYNEKQSLNSHPAEAKGTTTAKEAQQKPEPKSAPTTAPAKTIPVKSTPSEKGPAEPKGKEPEPVGKKSSQPKEEPEGKSTPAKGPTTAPTKTAALQKAPNKQQEEPKDSSSKGKEQEPKSKTATPVPIPSKSSSSSPSSPTLKSSSPPPVSHSPPPHQVSSSSPSTDSDPKFLGISTAFLINLAIILAVVALVIFILIKLYQRYRTRQDYNQTPENFAHKPVLGFNEEYYLSHNKIQRVIAPERITIDEQNPINGKIWQVEFKGTEKSAVYFHRRQNTTAYFQVEVISVHGSIEIGFVPVSSFPQLKSGEENIGNSGVGVTNSGYIQAQGENIYNYSWILVYGDVFGIGLTRENSKFSQRRAWISKNGVLLNYPPNDEMDRWLATIEISAEQKAEYNLGTEKKQQDKQEQDKEDEQKAKEKLQREKAEGLLKKQRISLKTFNKFQYYPVIVCHGNKDQNASTIINVNVGGQVFRMFDAQFRSGLLKDKSLFGDD